MSEEKKQHEAHDASELTDENLEDVSGGCFAPLPPVYEDPTITPLPTPPIYVPYPPKE